MSELETPVKGYRSRVYCADCGYEIDADDSVREVAGGIVHEECWRTSDGTEYPYNGSDQAYEDSKYR